MIGTCLRPTRHEYIDGVGVPKDLGKAEKWSMKSMQGNIQKLRSRENTFTPAHWFSLAAEQGNVDAQIRLGIAYMESGLAPCGRFKEEKIDQKEEEEGEGRRHGEKSSNRQAVQPSVRC